MAGKRKRRTILLRMISSAGTGYFYVAKRNTKPKQKVATLGKQVQNLATKKLEFMRYDPKVRKHVLFKQNPMK
jgi:large subunit ribosomal protein L33